MKRKMFLCLMALFIFIGASWLTACAPQTEIETPAPTAAVVTAAPVPHVLNIFSPGPPTTFNLHLSRATQDMEPARIVYEPLAVFDKDGELVPILAADIPSLDNGDLASDGKSVVWKLRQDVFWSDGKPFTADDVVFTYDYINDPEVKAETKSIYNQVTGVAALDDYTVKITFADVNPAWAVPFVGNGGVILPRHVFEAYTGENAAEAKTILPVGTGPYHVIEPGIKPQEVLLLGSQIVKTVKIVFEPNPYYRFKDRLFFTRIIWRGGGPADESARSLLLDGTTDVAYNINTIEPTQLAELLKNSDKGKLISVTGSGVTRILLNRTDPNHASASGEYSSLELPHPFFNDLRVRQAIAHAIDRDAIAALYVTGDQPTGANLVAPPQFRSPTMFYAYDPAAANKLLDEVGYLDTNGDGFREKDGVKIKFRLQGFTDTIIQQSQKIIQQNLKDIGIDVEIPNTDASIMFGDDKTNPDNAWRFNADMMIFQISGDSPDPLPYMEFWASASIPQQANNWTGLNFERWHSEDYDALLQQVKVTIEPAARERMFIALNDMLVKDVVMIPVVWNASVVGVSQKLVGLDPTPWDTFTWNIQDWSFAQP